MKTTKILALLLALTLTLAGCGVITSPDGHTEVITGQITIPEEEPRESQDTQPEEIDPFEIHIGALKGPTAMGMIYMISDDGVISYT